MTPEKQRQKDALALLLLGDAGTAPPADPRQALAAELQEHLAQGEERRAALGGQARDLGLFLLANLAPTAAGRDRTLGEIQSPWFQNLGRGVAEAQTNLPENIMENVRYGAGALQDVNDMLGASLSLTPEAREQYQQRLFTPKESILSPLMQLTLGAKAAVTGDDEGVDGAWEQVEQTAHGLKEFFWDDLLAQMGGLALRGDVPTAIRESPLDAIGALSGVAAAAKGTAMLGAKGATKAAAAVRRANGAAGESVGEATRRVFGAKNEQLGHQAGAAIDRARKAEALGALKIDADTQRLITSPGLIEFFERMMPWATEDRAAARAGGLRDFANRSTAVQKMDALLGAGLVRKLGLTHGELETMSKLIEAVKSNPVDQHGVLRFGVTDAIDGKQVLRHGIGPDEGRELWLKQRPRAQNAMLAVLAPDGGWPEGVQLKLPGKGYRYATEHVLTRPFTRSAPPPDGALLRGGQPLRRFAPKGDDVYDNLLEFIADGGGLAQNDYVWLGKTPQVAAEAMGLPPRMDVVLPRGGWSKGGKHLDSKHKSGFSPEEKAEAIIRCMDPTEVKPGFGPDGHQKFLFIRKNGSNTVAVMEAKLNDGYLELVSVVPRMSEQGLAAWVDKGNESVNRAGQLPPALSGPGHAKVAGSSPQAASLAAPVDNSSISTAVSDVKALDAAMPSQAGPKSSAAQGRGMGYWQALYKQYIDAFGPAEALEAFVADHAGVLPEAKLQNAARWLDGRRDEAGAANDATAKQWLLLPEPPRDLPRTMSRQALYNDLVGNGVLQPGQHREGYFTHMTAPEIGQGATNAPDLLALDVPGMARKYLHQNPTARFDIGLTTIRQAAHAAKINRELLREIAPLILEPAEGYAQLPARDWVRTVKEYNFAAGKEETRRESLTRVKIADPEMAKVMGMPVGDYMIPVKFAEEFDVLRGAVAKGELTGVGPLIGESIKNLARYWKQNILLMPATVVTNALGGLTQYGGKVAEDLIKALLPDAPRDDMRPPLVDRRQPFRDIWALGKALTPSAARMIPPELLGANTATQFGDMAQFAKGLNRRIAAGDKVNVPERILAAVDKSIAATLNLGLKPFGSIDNYYKRAIALSEARRWAAWMADKKGLKGAARRKAVEDVMLGIFDRHPHMHKAFDEIVNGAVDNWGFDYGNIPPWLQKFRDHPIGAMLVPFPVYGYKYARMLGRQATAPFAKGLPWQEKVARIGSLLGMTVGLDQLRQWLLGDDDDSEVLADYTAWLDNASGRDWPSVRLAGRDYIGKDDQGRERFLRTAKYPYANLASAARSADDLAGWLGEFKSEGPLWPAVAYAMGSEPSQGPRDVASVLGETAASFIPASRAWAARAKLEDTDSQGRIIHRKPKGFWEQFMLLSPSGRKSLTPASDQVTGLPVRLNHADEMLKELTGVNVRRVEPTQHRIAINRGVINTGKDAVSNAEAKAAIAAAVPGIDPANIGDDQVESAMRYGEAALKQTRGKGKVAAMEQWFRPDLKWDAEYQEAIDAQMRRGANASQMLASLEAMASDPATKNLLPLATKGKVIDHAKLVRLWGVALWARLHMAPQ